VSNRPLALRSMLAIVAIVAALAAIAIQAAGGSAQTTGKTLQLVAHTVKKAGFFPKGRPHAGDRFGFGDTISGDDTGLDRGVCTFVGGKSLCNVEAQLSKGSLSLQGFVIGKLSNTPLAVIGGTGAYDGANGTAFVTQVSKSTTNISVTLK
jgi:hypothetical protein